MVEIEAHTQCNLAVKQCHIHMMKCSLSRLDAKFLLLFLLSVLTGDNFVSYNPSLQSTPFADVKVTVKSKFPNKWRHNLQ